MQPCADCINDASGVMKKTPNGVRGGLCPAHRHRPGQPTPQGVGAIAAFERDDRAATLGAFRVVFLTKRVTKRGARCKRAAAFLTHRAPAPAPAAAWVQPLPQRTGKGCTWSRTASASLATASVRGDGGFVHVLPCTHRGETHAFPHRSGRNRVSRSTEVPSRQHLREGMRWRSHRRRRFWPGR